jgi:folate-binding protein YgfZ
MVKVWSMVKLEPMVLKHAHANDVSQVEAARRSVLAVREPDTEVIVVSGKDRVSWLNGLLTCDLVKGSATDGRYGLVVVRNGRVLTDAVVLRGSEAALLVIPAKVEDALRAHLDHYLVMEDAEMAPHAPHVVWGLHGPRAAEVLAAAQRSGAAGAVLDRTGLGGAVAVASVAEADAVESAIRVAVDQSDGVVGDAEGWDALRLERGLPRFGVDFDDKMYPQEASLEHVAVSFDKGCYLGQEVVCMLEMRGHVKRKLVPVVIDGEEIPERGDPVTDEAGGAVGEVTSAVASPTLGKAVALALVKRAHTEPGHKLLVGGRHAEVVQRPA